MNLITKLNQLVEDGIEACPHPTASEDVDYATTMAMNEGAVFFIVAIWVPGPLIGSRLGAALMVPSDALRTMDVDGMAQQLASSFEQLAQQRSALLAQANDASLLTQP